MSKNKNFPVIAIGSSANGINTLSELLSRLDPDIEATYIVMTHISSSTFTHFFSILENRCVLPIVIICDGMKIETKKVYISLDDKNIAIRDGKFYFYEEDVKNPISNLFKSISKEYKNRSVGVLLAGNGDDGSDGMKSIKDVQGWNIVQDPALAPYTSMPQSAIDIGVVDFVLSIRDMPSYISEIANEPHILLKELNNDDYKEIIDFMAKNKTTKFSNYKKTTIKRRIKNRISTLGLKTPKEYLKRLQNDETEVLSLINNLLINVTNFFRDEEAFESLTQEIKNLIVSKDNDEAFRVWIAGCSTGEEAYSVAIVLHEIFGDSFLKKEIKIFATDIDQEAIDKARVAFYEADKCENIPKDILKKYFEKINNGYKVIKNIRSKVIFGINDLTTAAPIAKVDLITCRNVLIYFDKELQTKVLRLFHYALNRNGLLFLGKSESNLLAPDIFKPINNTYKIYQKIDMNISLVTKRKKITEADKVEDISIYSGLEYNEISRFFEKILQNTNDGIISINKNYEITSINNSALKIFNIEKDDILESNFIQLVNGFATNEILTDIDRTLKTNAISKLDRHYCKDPIGREKYFHVTFIPFGENPNIVEQVILIIKDITTTVELKYELLELKQENKEHFNKMNILNEELQATNEELETVNEELQATNEELETTNEELEATNEELESSNEELNTINVDLEKLVEEKVAKIREQDKLIIQQSKMVAMGEMIGAIAHQWRQPLNELGLSIQNLKYDYKNGLLDDKFISKFINYNLNIIMFMSKTIDDFRNFFRIDKRKSNFEVKKTTQSVIDMLSAQLKSHYIEVEVSGEEFVYNGYISEYQQVILNIIGNAKDILVQKKINNPKIDIVVKDDVVVIRDNGGGIPRDIMDRIFEPYFSTKDVVHGSGIGLYMSKIIVEENMGAKLYARNIEDGACFLIDFRDKNRRG